MIDRYDWAGGAEAMLRFGPETGPIVVLALPLFEEANRTRAFAVTMLRALAERGLASVLPDVPGQGESERPTFLFRLDDARQALEDLTLSLSSQRPVYGAAIRSGALIAGQWQFSPTTGRDVVRDLSRVHQLVGGAPFVPGDIPVEVAGNLLAPDLLAALADAAPRDANRIVRFESDPREADRKVPGAPLWRRSEPGNDITLSQILADDIADWIETCGG